MGVKVRESKSTNTTSFIEVVSERFDGLNKEEQIKVLIHELMHIPHSFGGGFRTHKPYVTRKKVEGMYRRFVQARSGKEI